LENKRKAKAHEMGVKTTHALSCIWQKYVWENWSELEKRKAKWKCGQATFCQSV